MEIALGILTLIFFIAWIVKPGKVSCIHEWIYIKSMIETLTKYHPNRTIIRHYRVYECKMCKNCKKEYI